MGPRLWLQSHVLSKHFSSTVESSLSDLLATTSDRHSHSPSHSVGPSRKRDSISPEDSIEKDIKEDVLADIKADATAVEVTTDIDVEAGVDAGIGMKVDVGFDIEDEVEVEDEFSDKGTVMVGVDVVDGIDILDVMLILDARVEDIKTGQKELEARSLIAGRERAEALAAYEANHSAKLVVESQSQNGDDGDNGNVGGNGNGNGMGNGDENGGGNGNRNRGGNGNGNPNRNDRGDMHVSRKCTYHDFMKCQPLNFKGTKGVVGFTRWFEKIETVFYISNCLERYQVKYAMCTLLNSVLTWWNAQKRTVGADAAFAMSWRELMKLMTEVYCLRNEIQKMESELLNLTVKNNDLAAYTQRFQELTMMCTKMVPKEEERVEKFIGDQKLKGYAMRNAENKRRLDNNQRDNHRQQPLVKRQNVGGQNVARAYTAGNNEKRGYARPLLFCKKCKLHHEEQCTMRCSNYTKVRHMARDCKAAIATTTRGALEPNQKVVTCYECGRQGHYRSDCLKLKNQNHGNKMGNKTNEARGKTYVLGGGEANLNSNVVTGTFLLNNHYASIRSYAVELVNGGILETNIVLRGCTLGLLGHPFNIDLMPIELSSFNVIIGMDWLANHHAVIVYDEKIIQIPYGDEVLIVQVDRSGERKKSKLSIISCTKTQKYIKKEVFPEDLPRLPRTQQVEFQIDLVPGAALVARALYNVGYLNTHKVFAAALAVLITEASQSRQHNTLVRLPMDIRLKIDLGKSVTVSRCKQFL
ncbi:putative reverse transcriptase domain-containing protein [Tanacetum coccineum]|uniref:Reverse transcriptase domain-containing protein n=1 Tax=Tanacetum coccineum TaxID=301880 RepID=A0ABQ4YI36_9ASTR